MKNVESDALIQKFPDIISLETVVHYLDKSKKLLENVRDSKKYNMTHIINEYPKSGYIIDKFHFENIYKAEFEQPNITAQQSIQYSWQAKQIISQYEIFVKNTFQNIKRFSLLLSQRKYLQFLHDNFIRKVKYSTVPGRLIIMSTNNNKITTLQGPAGTVQQFYQAHCFSCIADQGSTIFVGFASSESQNYIFENRESTIQVLETVQSYTIDETTSFFNELKERHKNVDYTNFQDVKQILALVLSENYTFEQQTIQALATLKKLQFLYPIKRFQQSIDELENITKDNTIYELYLKLQQVITRIKNYIHNSNLERFSKGLQELDLREDYMRFLQSKQIHVVQYDPVTIFHQAKALK
ncbi:hypothetical protein SS50377_24773 [Spironucleus salmonicida]|uniref:Uncharacterized protein n=1 Tax=Spironucleus salmonicida TaxID=348837 RepID=A0A9P8RXM8_9EUKA|nr:hypothetical protein SS50377_24773 [Spironucleus salmonicida]